MADEHMFLKTRYLKENIVNFNKFVLWLTSADSIIKCNFNLHLLFYVCKYVQENSRYCHNFIQLFVLIGAIIVLIANHKFF